MDYSRNDLEKADADLLQAERRREWMSAVVSTLKSRNQQARVAERQLATFTAMSTAMRSHRKDIEDAIISEREAAVASTSEGPASTI